MGDSITTNNMLLQPVSVIDWFDIEVDLTWLDDNGDATDNAATGPTDKTFQLTVSLDGSTDWDARDVTILLGASGSGLDSATGDDGGDIVAGHSVTAGTLNSTAVTWQNMSDGAVSTDPGFQITGPRHELNWGDTFTYTGSVSPDSAVTSGTYKVTAILESFKVFAQKADCAAEENMTIDDGGTANDTSDDIIETITVLHMCDDGVSVADDVNSNSDDEIMGAVSNFHDISVMCNKPSIPPRSINAP